MEDTDPLVSYRLGAVRAGVQATVLALLVLILFRLMPGHGSVPPFAFATILFVASVGVAGVWRLPWKRLFHSGLGLRALYAWSVLDILLITAAVGVTGGGRSDLYLLYGLTTVFFGAAYPPRSQVALLAFTFACYLTILSVVGSHLGAGLLFLRCGMLVILAVLVSHLASELLRLIDSLQETKSRAERSAELLSTVAGSARRLTLESEPLLESLVDTVVDLGFQGAAMCRFDHEAGVFVVAHHRGMPLGYVERLHPADTDMPGLVRRSGQTQIVDAEHVVDPPPVLLDAGFHALIASPVWVDGWLAAALVGGSQDRRRVSALEAEAFQLLAAQAGLALENAQRFEETLHTVERLEELDKLKDNFLATASHEIRTPLTVILGSGLTLEQRWSELDDSIRHELVAALNRNAGALNNLIASLLDFARLGAESLQSNKEQCDLSQLVEGAVERLRSVFGQRPLEAHVAPGLMVHGDPFLLDRALENLLSNAAQHTPEDAHVRVSAEARHGWAVVTVADSGPGISEEDLRHLGERFYRGGDINTRGTKGLGLGLALVREILELHETDLEVETRLGLGSRFMFRLPLTTDQAGAIGSLLAGTRYSESEMS